MIPLRMVVLVSGGGTTLKNLLDRKYAGRLAGEIVGVASNTADCLAVQRAKWANLPVFVGETAGRSVGDYSSEFFQFAEECQADLVVAGGFLRKLWVPTEWDRRVINIHPSLIPAFCGKGYFGHRVHEAVLARSCKVSGCTVHYVDNEYDHGPIILQRVVNVLPGDTPESLAARVFAAECEALPDAIRLIAEKRGQVHF